MDTYSFIVERVRHKVLLVVVVLLVRVSLGAYAEHSNVANAITLVRMLKTGQRFDLEVNQDALEKLQTFRNAVVVGFFGVMRTGKSTRARALAKLAGYSATFPVSDYGDRGCTSGVMMLDRPLEYGGQNVVMLDMMGTDDVDWPEEVITKLLAFLSLQCDVVIQMEYQALTATAFPNLEKMIVAQQHIIKGSVEKRLRHPALIILIKDALPLAEGTPDQRLENFLTSASASASYQERCQKIKKLFPTRRLLLSAAPPANLGADEILARLYSQDLKAYRHSCNELWNSIMSLCYSTRRGEDISVEFGLTINALNSGTVHIPTILERTGEIRSATIAKVALREFDRIMGASLDALSGDDAELQATIRQAKAQAEKLFDTETIGFTSVGMAKDNLQTAMEGKVDGYLAMNAAVRAKKEAEEAKWQTREKWETFWNVVQTVVVIGQLVQTVHGAFAASNPPKLKLPEPTYIYVHEE
mmetsp:Transcript_40784/g.66142  ORF Transcript_40784/g.66142 Transcript_40784/m.66142 type:complete len:472 (+) Transcript_40784:117-1532(+)